MRGLEAAGKAKEHQLVFPTPGCGMGSPRPRVGGKFLWVGDEKLYVRGVTYGTFRPSADGNQFPDPEVIERDFAAMAANGLNAVRTYTVPPLGVLDAALRHNLRVMVGLPWEQHVAFLEDEKRARSIEERVGAGVRACAGHPAVLSYVIGNEIPASIVRWHGRRRVARFLERLYRAAKAQDPEGLVTYVSYPSTEYLDLPFLDLVCFNVYLESRERLSNYLARLQNIAGDRPLLLAELGLDGLRHGEKAQADALGWQLSAAFTGGCAGAFVFAWTDEWHRGGYDIEDWAFGLTDRRRRPKAALAAVREAFAGAPFPADMAWPRVSVLVCTYNGSRTIRECCEGLMKLDYPDYEVIVVDDGSTDETASIALEYGFRVIRTEENRGLSSARNAGLQVATGEIVAFIDDDACPDPHWLTYLTATFRETAYAGVGGPNIPPPDGLIADCVAHAPGGPIHVLLSDREAEHIPGCNMAFRKSRLEAVGGFDPQFRRAGDDVDICWRLRQAGDNLGFSPAAMVWHRRRDSVRGYWEQQQGYGAAEALLERKWPEKFNSVGHLSWSGRLYGKGLFQALGWRRERIYHGPGGSALFQSVYEPAASMLGSLPLTPEWYLVVIALAALAALGPLWQPLLLALPLLALALGASLTQAGLGAASASFPGVPRSRFRAFKMHALIMFLYLVQPLARLSGRLRKGLSPWRQRGVKRLTLPWPRAYTVWSERWRAPGDRLQTLLRKLRATGVRARLGGEYDRWDMEVRGGLFGLARLRMAVEEHGAGRQLVRLRSWPKWSWKGLLMAVVSAGLSIGAAVDGAPVVSVAFGASATLLAVRALRECGASLATLLRATRGGDAVSEELDHSSRPSRAAEPALVRVPFGTDSLPVHGLHSTNESVRGRRVASGVSLLDLRSDERGDESDERAAHIA